MEPTLLLTLQNLLPSTLIYLKVLNVLTLHESQNLSWPTILVLLKILIQQEAPDKWKDFVLHLEAQGWDVFLNQSPHVFFKDFLNSSVSVDSNQTLLESLGRLNLATSIKGPVKQ